MLLPALAMVATAGAQDENTLTPPLVSARGMAMGNSLVPTVDDASASIWNPARLTRIPRFSAMIDWSRFDFSVHQLYVGAGYGDGVNGFGISYRTVDLGNLVGFHFDERTITLGYGRRFNNLSVGLAYNFVDVSSAFANAKGNHWTFGLDYETDDQWVFAFRASDVGSRLTYDGAPTVHSRSMYDIAAAKSFRVDGRNLLVSATLADFGKVKFHHMVRLGAELELEQGFKLRAGLQGGRLTGGLGFETPQGFSAAIAFASFPGIGRVFSITAGFRF